MRKIVVTVAAGLLLLTGCAPAGTTDRAGATPTVSATADLLRTSPTPSPTGQVTPSPSPTAVARLSTPGAPSGRSGAASGKPGTSSKKSGSGSGSCGAEYYRNVDGVCVHRPVSGGGSKPSGATAKCKDGTYSFSQHRRGTCSGHGGVEIWY
ncbi:DUF3761 domain-containing protein [Micromonospora zhanjiangensis]|uniref:DUF3761 domain-containing protein n=1 Tax=Micromonospora zhanjiangensis TaxID=1522057 RepID=A0ABV8KIF3_9ACTN